MRIGCIQALAIALKERYYLLGQVDDLEQSILHYTETILLSPHWDRHCPNIAQNFLSTAFLLLLRAAHTKGAEQPEGVKRSVIYLRYLRRQSPEAFNIAPNLVKVIFMGALTLQVGLKLGDVMQDIEEMADFFLEFLNSDISTISAGIMVTFFAEAVRPLVWRWRFGKEPPAKVIDCLRNAKIRLPDSDKLSITLAGTPLNRFFIAHSNDDYYEEGTAILDKFLSSHAPRDDQNQYREALQLISMFAYFRWTASRKPEHLEEAIYRLQKLLPWIPLEDPIRPHVVQNPTFLQSRHFEYFGFGHDGVQEEDSFDSAFSASHHFGI